MLANLICVRERACAHIDMQAEFGMGGAAHCALLALLEVTVEVTPRR